MSKETIYATILLVVVSVIGATYWLLGGYVQSGQLQKYLLGQAWYFGLIVTIIFIIAAVLSLSRR